jgi:deazaflavin-dependent oxidoreductase (nitroreductase family)
MLLIIRPYKEIHMSAMRGFFRILNRFFMVPIFRFGLGPLIVNPLTGYILVLRTIGHKTGKVRYVPVNYAVDGGCVYCLAGFGKTAHWYRNLQADPKVEAILPGGAIFGLAETVTDEAEFLRMGRRIFRNAGFVGFLSGINPRTCSDEQMAGVLKNEILLRIRPEGPGSGPADPGGWGWILGWAAGAVCILAIIWLLV